MMNDEDEDAAILRQGIVDAVETQIGEREPPETGKTLQRLMEEGQTREEAIRLIACVLTDEMFQIMKHEREFNRVRYVRALEDLPRLPWE